MKRALRALGLYTPLKDYSPKDLNTMTTQSAG